MGMTAEERDEQRRIAEAVNKLSAIPGNIEALRHDYTRLEDRVREAEIDAAAGQAEHSGRLTTLEARATGVSNSLKEHVDDHWKWISAAAAVVMATIALMKWATESKPAPHRQERPGYYYEGRQDRGDSDYPSAPAAESNATRQVRR